VVVVLEGLLEKLGGVGMSFVGGVDGPIAGGEAANCGGIDACVAFSSFQPLIALTRQITATNNNTPAATVLHVKG
jgi:hypothetical protein